MPERDPTSSDSLSAYRRKRSAHRTPEPFSGRRSESGNIYVIQKHAARRLHYDFRLELNDVLLSWAVPNGPSRNPADKQLAVHVEDHPIEYAEFEGIIPAGNYGAGAVIVWDRGRFDWLEDPVTGLEKGKLLFELRGQKLRGRWTLVKIKKAEKEWLLIKERDAFVSENGQDLPQDSVLSGLTVDELKSGHSRSREIQDALHELKATRATIRAANVEVMHAETADKPFTRAGWLFELKYDGYRLLGEKSGDHALLITRNGNDATQTFPEIARAVAALPFEHIILDGEVVVQDDDGKPNFQRLQQRGRYLREIDGRRAALEHPATFFAFDLLAVDGYDLRSLPLTERKRLLQRALPSSGLLRFTEHIETRGEDFYRAAEQLGLEGIVAKRADSKYRGIRSNDWLKLRIDKSDDFVIVGYTAPRGSRTAFGALHLAVYRDEQLTYAGSVGSGFTDKLLNTIKKQLDEHVVKKVPFAGGPPGKGHTWVEPLYVCEVRYKEWTDEPLLRHPVFLRMRDDKRPEECGGARDGGGGVGFPDAGADPDGDAGNMDADADAVTEVKGRGIKRGITKRGKPNVRSTPPPPPSPPASESPNSASVSQRSPQVTLTNVDKVFFPEHNLTKGDLVAYYRAVAPWLLPYLKERPVTLTRFPDGIHGKSFFQKDAPDWTPAWVRTELMWSEEAQREVRQFICDDEPTLVYLANSGTIPLHIASSRLGSLEKPDWCSLDLDPKDAPFERVIEVAQVTKALCDAIGLPAFVKTTGSSGLHVLIPVARLVTHEQCKQLAELLARAIVAQQPDIATIERVISKRAGRVYVDFGQNGHGKLLVSPLCVRPIPGAPVSMPIEWAEVQPGLTPTQFTIQNAIARLHERGDPLRAVLAVKPDLMAALSKLYERL
ncbi:MAG: DNA ligase D [Gemmatimonadota bacterium]